MLFVVCTDKYIINMHTYTLVYSGRQIIFQRNLGCLFFFNFKQYDLQIKGLTTILSIGKL